MNAQLLKKHFEETPRMEPQDAVKLAFQSAFGCGHLMPDRKVCIEMIQRELDKRPPDGTPLYAPIGNGLCRLNLRAPLAHELGAEMICRMMEAADRRVRARRDTELRYTSAINDIIALAHKGEAPFSYEQLRAYLDEYHENGRGVVSHTQTYRDAYQPSYRVVLEDYALLAPVLSEIIHGRKLVVFDGPCGSGKTTLAGRLGEMCSAVPIPMDDFFLPPSMRTPERLAEPGGNVHRERFMDEVLASLPGGVRWQRYDCATGQMLKRSAVDSGLYIIEGSYSHHPAFAARYRELNALRVYVDVNPQEQLRRIEKRDPDMLGAFQTRWIPLEKNYFEAYDIRDRADIVIHSPESA